MRKVILAVALVSSLLVPARAQAVLLINPDGSRAEPYQTWAERAKVPTSTETLVLNLFVDLDQCSRRYGCTGANDPIVHIWRPWCIGVPAKCRETLLHELGHRFDYQMADWRRTWFMRAASRGREWRAGHNPPHERFAEAYGLCAVSTNLKTVLRHTGRRFDAAHFSKRTKYQFGYGLMLDGDLHRRICKLIRQPN